MAAGDLAPSGRVRTCALFVLSFVSFSLFGQVVAGGAAKPVALDSDGRVTIFVQLTEQSAARVYADVLNAGGGGTAASRSANVIAAADSAGRAQRAVAVRQQTRFMAQLQASGVKFTEIYRVQRALNGVAMKVDGSAIARIRNLPDVARILPMQPQYPTSAPPTSNAVPFMQVPTVWQLMAGANHADGTGIRIGIIDSGIDYIHADFGGSGLLADYTANQSTPGLFFPTSKVVGGIDLAGDAYNGSNTPLPDPYPMDCGGHGTHVAGIAAGYGVTSTGGTFAGPYDGTVPFSTLRIHPGVAPKALLYAIRVFGCGGSTNLVIEGIDWALDPNNDGNLSDHLDVVNLSLGSPFGSTEDPELQAADAAAAAGMSLAISAGNSGNVYFIVGAPGAADRATTVAASIDNGYPGAGFRVNTPAAIAGFYNGSVAAGFGGVAPDGGLTGNVVLVDDGAGTRTDGCTALTPTNAMQILGNIAIFDRNTAVCTNDTPALNAQNAGAIAAIQIYNAATVPLPDVAGTNPAVTIPYIRVSQADGATLKNNLAAGLNVTLYNGGDQLAYFSSRGPRGSSVVRLKPDIAAPGVNIFSAETGNSCTTASNAGCIFPSTSGFNPGSLAARLSGTSMAAPQVTGLTALMRQIHPDWSVEEIKALLMNTGSHAVTQFPAGNGLPWTPPLVGSGRPDPPTAAQSNSVAFNAEGNGSVSVSFGDDFATPATRTGKVRVENKGASAVTYDLAIVPAIDAPGLSYSLPGGNSLTVLAGASQTIDVRLNANPAQMQHTRDATMPPNEVDMASLGTLNKQFVTEESAYLTFSIGGVEKMRVPLYAVSRPASQMAGSSPANGSGTTGSGTITLSGSGVCTGTLGSTCTGSFPTDEVSLVSPFEMQVVSPRDPVNSTPSADIQYAGVAYDPANNLLMFGVSTYGDWSTPSETSVNIYIDNNNDGLWDYVIFNGGAGYIGQVFGQSTANGDAQINATYNISTGFGKWGALSGGVLPPSTYTNGDPGQRDNALMRNNTVILKALRADVGVTGPFHYKVVTCPGWALVCQEFYGFHYDEATGPYLFDFSNQGLNFGGASLVQDLPGATIPVTWNTTNLTNQGALGALLLHHHNVAGQRAQFIPLNGATTADIGVSASVSPANATQGQNITLTVTATNNGPSAASSVSLWVPVPIGTNWVSDSGGGTYNPNTEIWTVGALANGASSSHQIIFNRVSSSPVLIQAKLSASSPLDANAANNSVRFLYPSAADLSLAVSPASPTVLTGNAATFTYTITNNGSDPAYNVSVATSLTGFAGLTYSSPVASAGVFNPATGLWTIAGLDASSSATLQFNVTAPNAIGTLATSGTASSDISDPVPSNNAASASVQVLSPATLSATMAHGGSTTPGFTTTYTVAIHNSGSHDQQDNPGDEFTLVAPSQVSVTAATASSGTASFAVNTVHWNGVVPTGGTVTITISATIGAVPSGTVISAQGGVFFDADGNGTNESTALTDDPATPTAGDATSFIVTTPIGSSISSTTYSTLSQPCRIIDTRLGGGSLAGGVSRNFHVVGATGFTPQGGNSSGCSVPAGATAAVINFVAVSPAGAGNLRGSAFPNAVPSIGSVINYAQETPALNIANGIIFPICDPSVNDCSIADITLLANGSATDVVADVLGYFMRFPTEQIRTFAVTNFTGGGTTIGSSCTNLATITVNAPTAGTVVVDAYVLTSVPHTSGTTDSAVVSINTSPVVCLATALGEVAEVSAADPTAVYKILARMQRAFPVGSGSATYYINAQTTAGSTGQTLQNAGVVATFHPN